jgi:hypothetical protein
MGSQSLMGTKVPPPCAMGSVEHPSGAEQRAGKGDDSILLSSGLSNQETDPFPFLPKMGAAPRYPGYPQRLLDWRRPRLRLNLVSLPLSIRRIIICCIVQLTQARGSGLHLAQTHLFTLFLFLAEIPT